MRDTDTANGARPEHHYRRLLHTRGVVGFAAVGAVAFLGVGAEPLAMLLFLVHSTGSFAAAGTIIACYGVGSAATAPIRGRLADRFGAPVIAIVAVAHAFLMVVLVLAGERHAPPVGVAVLAAVVGAFFSMVNSAMRSGWSRLSAEQDRDAAYSIQSILQEVGYIGGPLLAGAMVAAFGPRTSLLCSTGLTLAATVVFARLPAIRSQVPEKPATTGRLPMFMSRSLLVLIATVVPVDFAFGAIEVALPGYASEHGQAGLSGILIALIAIGSILGGLAYGRRTWTSPVPVRYIAILLALAALMAALALARGLPMIAAVTLAVGLPAAPMVTCRYLVLDRSVPAARANEAFMWITTADVIGDAGGQAVGGFLIEHTSFASVALLSGLVVGIAVLAAVLGRQTLGGVSRADDVSP